MRLMFCIFFFSLFSFTRNTVSTCRAPVVPLFPQLTPLLPVRTCSGWSSQQSSPQCQTHTHAHTLMGSLCLVVLLSWGTQLCPGQGWFAPLEMLVVDAREMSKWETFFYCLVFSHSFCGNVVMHKAILQGSRGKTCTNIPRFQLVVRRMVSKSLKSQRLGKNYGYAI